MFELAKNEIKRYQKWAWLWALLIIALHILIMRFRPFLEPSAAEGILNNLLLMGGSFLFGIVQMALHKRKNHWTFLIHRPLAPLHIFTSVFVAGSTIIFIAASLPWMLTILGLDLFGKGVVELRHYLYILFLTLACLMTYQIALLLVTNASWGICLMVVMLVVVLLPKANSLINQFFPLIIFNLVLFYLNCKSFKPDLSTYLKSPFQQILMAIPMSFALIYMLVMSTTVYYHLPKFALGTHPDNHPVNGSFRYMFSLKDSDYLAYVLKEEGSRIADESLAASLIQQAALANMSFLDTSQRNPPWRHQLHVDDYSYEIVNTENDKHFQKSWQFSHENMLLMAHNRITGEMEGMIGKNGFLDSASEVRQEDRFNEIPYLFRNQYLVFSDKILSIDFDQEMLTEKYSLGKDERFVDAPKLNTDADMVYAITTKRILLFDANIFSYEYAELAHSFAISLPVGLKNIGRIMLGELADGYAIMFYGRDYFGRDKAGSDVYFLPYNNEPVLVGSREFTVYSHPDWIEQFDYMVSPAFFMSLNALFHHLDPAQFEVITPQDLNIIPQALILHLVSLASILFLMRFHTLSMKNKVVWTIFVLLMSLPGLISFVLLHPFKGVYKFRAKTDRIEVSEKLSNA